MLQVRYSDEANLTNTPLALTNGLTWHKDNAAGDTNLQMDRP